MIETPHYQFVYDSVYEVKNTPTPLGDWNFSIGAESSEYAVKNTPTPLGDWNIIIFINNFKRIELKTPLHR